MKADDSTVVRSRVVVKAFGREPCEVRKKEAGRRVALSCYPV